MSHLTSRLQRSFTFAILPLAFGLIHCGGAEDKDKSAEQANTVQGFPPGGECPKPGSACWVPGYSADCFHEGDPYNCECVPTGLYNAHNWLCEFQGGGGSAGAGGGPGGSGGSGGSPGGSCIGPNGELFCGAASPDGCFCDDACEQFGDCCFDKPFVCGGTAGSGGAAGAGGGPGGGSCIGDFGELFCGGASDDGCFCDDLCEQFGDCCPDKPFVCGGSGGSGGSGGGPGEGSCFDKFTGEIFCGGQSPDGCFCDDECEFFGNCCSDKQLFCGGGGGSGGAAGAGGGPGFGSCLSPDGQNFCGGFSPDGCFCDEICFEAGDCCPDKFEVCGGQGGSGGAAGAGGAGGAGGGGNACSGAINECAADGKCAVVLDCLVECNKAGISSAEALGICSSATGGSINPVLGALLQCSSSTCAADCSTAAPPDPSATCPPVVFNNFPACGAGAEQVSACFGCFCAN
jgi:hypothetical protein